MTRYAVSTDVDGAYQQIEAVQTVAQADGAWRTV
jgi:hypothetical protein